MSWNRLSFTCLLLIVLIDAVHADGSRRDPYEALEIAPTMAVTIDDLPIATASRFNAEQKQIITRRLLETLTTRGVPAIGFVNEVQLFNEEGEIESEEVALLTQWLDAGMELGNHGYSHLSLNREDPMIWMADVDRGDTITQRLLKARGQTADWFRHPFLHVGRSAEVQAQTAEFLADEGYRIAPISIDNSDWIYADAYAWAWLAGDEEQMNRLGTDYVRYMLEVVEFYEDQSLKIVGEPLPHTLLIHANALNADWLDELLDALGERGYRWVDLDTATRHPAYDREIHGYTGPGGITWLHRWALTDGVDPVIFSGEPEVPDWVNALRQQRN
ncbi:MAG: polysaccharide deacetylase family protein [Pseudomonadota bacterium]